MPESRIHSRGISNISFDRGECGMSAPEVAKIHAELLIHHRFHSIYQKFISKKDPKCVWEIGALDGLDSVSLKNEFPSTQFTAFEPTPDSFKITSRNLLSIGGGCLSDCSF